MLAACELMPACVGQPVYYLSLPLFPELTLHVKGPQRLAIRVENYGPDRRYIQAVRLNGKALQRNWLTHQELAAGGTLVFVTADEPNLTWGTQQWLSAVLATEGRAAAGSQGGPG